jgi:hypothetical protein
MHKSDQGDTWDVGLFRMSNVVTCTCRSSEDLKEAFEDLEDRGALFDIVSQWTVSTEMQQNRSGAICGSKMELVPFTMKGC